MAAWARKAVTEKVRRNPLRKHFHLRDWNSLCRAHFPAYFQMVASFHSLCSNLSINSSEIPSSKFFLELPRTSLIHSFIHSIDTFWMPDRCAKQGWWCCDREQNRESHSPWSSLSGWARTIPTTRQTHECQAAGGLEGNTAGGNWEGAGGRLLVHIGGRNWLYSKALFWADTWRTLRNKPCGSGYRTFQAEGAAQLQEFRGRHVLGAFQEEHNTETRVAGASERRNAV